MPRGPNFCLDPTCRSAEDFAPTRAHKGKNFWESSLPLAGESPSIPQQLRDDPSAVGFEDDHDHRKPILLARFTPLAHPDLGP
jgi:hypothetical protein